MEKDHLEASFHITISEYDPNRTSSTLFVECPVACSTRPTATFQVSKACMKRKAQTEGLSKNGRVSAAADVTRGTLEVSNEKVNCDSTAFEVHLDPIQ